MLCIMFETEEKIRKNIIALNEDEFQIRYLRNEDVGILTSRSDKSYFILDSKDYWYDLIQEQYPNKQKCSCKNDFFKVSFDYVPRKGTDDYRSVELIFQCTKCGKIKKTIQIDIDYSPSSQLFEQAITFCAQPKIKYKTYSINGYWKKEDLYGLIEYLYDKQFLIYLWYWNQVDNKRYFNRFTSLELIKFLSTEKQRYLGIYFSLEPLDENFKYVYFDKNGIYINQDIWRKKELIKINSPIKVIAENGGDLYYMDFCSEYIDSEGKVKTKNELFCHLTKEILAYSKKRMK